MSERPKVVSWERTCIALPSQWEAELSDGRWAYIRYRWGRFTVSVGSSVDGAIANHYGEAMSELIGGPLDGDMDDAEMMGLTRGLFDWGNA